MMLRTAVLLAAFTMVTGTAAATASRAVASPAQSYNGLALTPPMGFNNWAGFECNNRFGEKLFLDTADAMVRLGLDKLGYNQVNIDDCWMQRNRDANGNLQVDTTRSPARTHACPRAVRRTRSRHWATTYTARA